MPRLDRIPERRALVAALALLVSSCAHQTPCRTTERAPLVLTLRDRMSGVFAIEHVELAVDDRMLIATDIADPDPLVRQWSVGRESLSAGAHTIRVYFRYRAAPWRYGVFAYIVGYKFHVRSAFTVDVREDAPPSRITIDAYERGTITTEIPDRPAMRCTLDEGTRCARSCGDSSVTSRTLR